MREYILALKHKKKLLLSNGRYVDVLIFYMNASSFNSMYWMCSQGVVVLIRVLSIEYSLKKLPWNVTGTLVNLNSSVIFSTDMGTRQAVLVVNGICHTVFRITLIFVCNGGRKDGLDLFILIASIIVLH